jgi:hypothetical protein
VTRLRQIMLEELRRRNTPSPPIQIYIHTVEQFSRHCGFVQVGFEEMAIDLLQARFWTARKHRRTQDGAICLAQCVPARAFKENAIHGPLHTASAHRDR